MSSRGGICGFAVFGEISGAHCKKGYSSLRLTPAKIRFPCLALPLRRDLEVRMADTVLVTGGAGFIGSFIVDALVRKGYKVRVLDNLDPQVHPEGKVPDHLSKEAEFQKGDIRDYEALRRALDGVQYVIHQAAAVGVGQSQYEIKRYVEVNIQGTANLLDVLAHDLDGIRKILVAGSMSEYGEGGYRCPKCGPVGGEFRSDEELGRGEWKLRCPKCAAALAPVGTSEDKPLAPASVYAVTKVAQEQLVMNFARAYRVPAVCLRYFNVFGPRQALSNPYTGAAAIFIARLKNNHPPVIYEDGRQTRDFISVRDIARANVMALESGRADYRTFNVGTGRPTSILELAQGLRKFLGCGPEPKVTGEFRAGDIRHCFADISGIRNALGFEPEVGLELALRELVEWAGGQRAVDRFEKAVSELKARGLS